MRIRDEFCLIDRPSGNLAWDPPHVASLTEQWGDTGGVRYVSDSNYRNFMSRVARVRIDEE